jgi:hypothetical protein
MIKCTEEIGVLWPNVSMDIREFPCDCGCALSRVARSLGWDLESGSLYHDISCEQGRRILAIIFAGEGSGQDSLSHPEGN